MTRCIYTQPSGLCAGTSPLTDEHVLPRGFGNFNGFIELSNKLCHCNSDPLGKLDEVLLHSSPEALVRMAHGVSGRKNHRAKDLFHERSHGRPPIELEALLPNDDSPTRLEVTELGIAQPRRELVFESDQDQRVVPIPHSVATVDALNEHLGRYGVLARAWPRIRVNCSVDDVEFIAMIEQRFGDIKSEQGEPDRTGYPSVVQASALFKFPPEYFRAIAKIAFHFFLSCFSPPFSGLEPAFDDIKRLIYQGGEPERLMRCVPGEIVPSSEKFPWAHVLAAVWTGREMAASVQLFHGSNSGMGFIAGNNSGPVASGNLKEFGMVWFVRLGRTDSIYPAQRKAFAYLGCNKKQNGFDGEVRALRPTDGSNGQFWSLD
jgi:hypothetical protein